MIFNLRNFVAFFMLATSVLAMSHVKYVVKNLKKELVEINSQMADSKEQIHTLKAEWAYLSSPERIKRLSDRYLDLKYSSSAQVKNETQMKTAFAKNTTDYNKVAVSPTLRPIFSSASY